MPKTSSYWGGLLGKACAKSVNKLFSKRLVFTQVSWATCSPWYKPRGFTQFLNTGWTGFYTMSFFVLKVLLGGKYTQTTGPIKKITNSYIYI